MTGNAGGGQRLVGTEEVAAYLGVEARTLAASWRTWGLKPYRVGSRLKYRVSEIERYLDEHRAA